MHRFLLSLLIYSFAFLGCNSNISDVVQLSHCQTDKSIIGHVSDKCDISQSGGDGYLIAQRFDNVSSPSSSMNISSIIMRLDTSLPKNKRKVTMNGLNYNDGRYKMARLKIDLCQVNADKNEPGPSYIDGGIIYEVPISHGLDHRQYYCFKLERAIPISDDSFFVVLEWVVDGNDRIQDEIKPNLWQTNLSDDGSSLEKWPINSDWRVINSPDSSFPRTHCIGIKYE